MQFSDRTTTIIKNFSGINPSLVLKPGNTIKTISPQKTIVASAEISDEIPGTAHIFNVSRLLSIMSLYEKPNLEFEEKRFIISEGKKKTYYTFADPSNIILPPEKEVKFPSVDVEVDVSWENLQSVMKAADILQLPEVAFVGDSGACYIKAIKSAETSADTFGVELGETEDTFCLILKTENLKMLPGDYKVSLSSKGISKFTGKDVKYWVAVESKSTYQKG
jgi:hypothetical protein